MNELDQSINNLRARHNHAYVPEMKQSGMDEPEPLDQCDCRSPVIEGKCMGCGQPKSVGPALDQNHKPALIDRQCTQCGLTGDHADWCTYVIYLAHNPPLI